MNSYLKKYPMRRLCQGLTLVELMIALVLSLLLMSGAISIFMSSKQTFKLEENVSRIQESMRYVASRFINDFAGGGFYGCAQSSKDGNSNVTNVVSYSGGDDWKTPLYDFAQPLIGVEGASGAPDSLTMHYAKAGVAVPVTTSMGSQTGSVPVDQNVATYSELEAGDIISVSDCDALAIFMLTNDPGNSGLLAHDTNTTLNNVSNSEAGIQHVFGDTRFSAATVYEMEAVNYQVLATGPVGSKISGLFATRLGGERQLLIAGVQDFQVTYGVDQDNDGSADRYTDWDSVGSANIDLITSLRIFLEINPGTPVADSQGKMADDETREFTFTIKLRNRGGTI
ncbi:PilW family protein [endosymbiont of Ridgeia piscesae]|jgi:type IV pilus assembly protein PilW|uniref:Prepilin-type N-terminal cleavage/methylation domain n=2 Tax=sulfur-oxidizing symbionts TaxID=32036 RepID=A0A0T5ZA94_9GAMM|nr:PilW family protein [endosymbiont of Ridgeia piscesae]KRT55381.1 prepilin-type N-terminal cleavage/methylation domain [endosymbiont of Ridgeia piscesae]KRT59785.1 type IV pilus assembly protein PilW [endosymbiont of Ridgeia piscesae]